MICKSDTSLSGNEIDRANRMLQGRGFVYIKSEGQQLSMKLLQQKAFIKSGLENLNTFTQVIRL